MQPVSLVHGQETQQICEHVEKVQKFTNFNIHQVLGSGKPRHCAHHLTECLQCDLMFSPFRIWSHWEYFHISTHLINDKAQMSQFCLPGSLSLITSLHCPQTKTWNRFHWPAPQNIETIRRSQRNLVSVEAMKTNSIWQYGFSSVKLHLLNNTDNQ